MRKAVKYIENNIRITNTNEPLDTLTFSLDSLIKIEYLLELFWVISKK